MEIVPSYGCLALCWQRGQALYSAQSKGGLS